MIDASLNEVEGYAARAARGAGLAWGMAEETGKAARWLAACGLAWAPSLVALLDELPALSPPRPGKDEPLTSALPDMPLSPLAVGSYLADLGPLAGTHEIGPCAQPLWLLPFAAQAAAALQAAVIVGWDEVSVTVWPFGGDVTGDFAALTANRARRVSWVPLAPGATTVQPAMPLSRAGRSAVAPAVWQRLTEIGARTYVPASDLSRNSGAGAGNLDND